MGVFQCVASVYVLIAMITLYPKSDYPAFIS
jgi:hypothetical protein